MAANIQGKYGHKTRTVQNALIKYLSKYLTKDEPHSETLKELTEKLLHQSDGQECEQMNATRAYTKHLLNSVANRDITSQEVTYTLMEHPAYKTSETFVIISLKQREIDTEQQTRAIKRSDYQKYLDRSNEHDMSMHEYVQHFNLDTNNKLRKARNQRIFP